MYLFHLALFVCLLTTIHGQNLQFDSITSIAKGALKTKVFSILFLNGIATPHIKFY